MPDISKRRMRMNSDSGQVKSNYLRNKMLIAGAMLLAAVVLGYFFFRGDKPEVVPTGVKGNVPQPETVIAGIDSVVREFGIDKKWISDRKGDQKSSKVTNRLWFLKEVRLPVDLPAMNVNLDLTSFLSDNNLMARTREDPRSKNLRIDVLNSADTIEGKIGQINLIYSDSVNRVASDVCIILDSIEYADIKEAENVLSLGNDFSVIMPLRNDKADFQSLIFERKTDYLLELTSGNDEAYDADFREGMTEKDWRSKIRSLCLNFPSASGIIIRGTDLNAGFGKDIKDEFEKFGMNVLTDASLVNGSYNSDKARSLIENLKLRSSTGVKKIVVLTTLEQSEFAEFIQMTSALRKRGFRFMEFREIFRRIKQENEKDSLAANPQKMQNQKK